MENWGQMRWKGGKAQGKGKGYQRKKEKADIV